jgi:HEAT repeat protein
VNFQVIFAEMLMSSQVRGAIPCGVIVTMLACLLASCGHPELRGKEMRAEEPPAPPKQILTPLDSALRDRATEELQKAYHGTDPFLRANAVEGMQMTLGADARVDILNALEDHTSIVCFAACMACGDLRLAEAGPKLQAIADGHDTHAEVAALYALHRLGNVRRSHRLEALARAPDTGTRADVATVLGRLGEPSGMNILKVLKNDDDFAVRAAAWQAMWCLGDKEGLNNLVALTVSQHPDDQFIGLLGMAVPKDRRVAGNLRGLLTSDYAEVALAAARALGEVGMDDGYAVVMKYVDSPDARVRALAAFALGAIGRSDAQPKLAILLRDNDPHVRLAAAVAILRLKQPNIDAAQAS